MKGLGGRLCVFASCFAWSMTAAAQLVTPPPTPSYQLVNTKDAKIVVPLEPVPGAQITGASVSRVTAEDVQQPALLGAFTPSLTDGGLTIGVNPEIVRAPDHYGISIGLKGTLVKTGVAPPETAQQTLDVVLVLPPARLAPIPNISRRLERWPWGGSALEVGLTLRETSKLTSISGLYIEQLTPTLNDEQQVLAELVPRNPPNSLAAGTRQLLTLDGKQFDVGTSKGTLTISGDQLEGPVEVPFEVKTRIFDWLMIPWFLVFGLLGWLVRDRLQNAAVRAELRVELDRLHGEVEEERATNPDTKNLEKLLTDALSVSKGSDNAKLKTALEALNGGLDVARAAKAKIASNLLERIGTLEQVLGIRFDLPSGLDLTQAQGRLTGASNALRADSVKLAQTELKAFDDSIVALFESVDAWQRSLQDALAPFRTSAGKGKLVLPSAVQDQAQRLLEQLDQALAKATFDPAAAPPVGDYLRAIHDVNLAARRLAHELYAAFRQAAEAADNVLRQASKPAALAKVLEDLPAPARDVTKADFDRLADALRGAFEVLSPLLRHAEAKALLNEGKFAEAVARDETLSSGGGFVNVAAVASRPAAAALAAQETMAPEVLVGRPRVVIMSTVPSPRARERRLVELKTLQFTRGLVSALLMAATSWVLYRESWVGTAGDFAGVAAFAFFSDFTLDAALDLAGKIKKVSPT